MSAATAISISGMPATSSMRHGPPGVQPPAVTSAAAVSAAAASAGGAVRTFGRAIAPITSQPAAGSTADTNSAAVSSGAQG